MARGLIVTAHPLGRSLTAHLAGLAEARLVALGLDVTRLDLYAAGFDPVLSVAERASTYAARYDRSRIAAEAAALAEAEVLVLVFPTWWFGLPAILKGWIDRVWVPGLAYDHASDLGPIKGRLKGLKRVIVVTTLGAPAWIDWLVMRRPVRRVLKWGVVKVCAPGARFDFLSLYSAEKLAPARLERFAKRLERVIG